MPTCDTENCPKQNRLQREQPTTAKLRRPGRPKLTASQKEKRKQMKARGELPLPKLEIVYNSEGKAIGKKDPDGKFIPYKARGRPKEHSR